MKKTWLVILIFVGGFTAISGQVFAKTVFKDVSSNYWAKDAIEELSRDQIITGFTDGTFKPEMIVTRAQSAAILSRTLGIGIGEYSNPDFMDLSKTHWAYSYIAALVDREVFSKATRFNPNDGLTRAQMAKILVVAFDLSGTSENKFTDVPSYHWANEYIYILAATGITTGTTKTTYSPEEVVTRAQMSVLIKRTLDYIDHPAIELIDVGIVE